MVKIDNNEADRQITNKALSNTAFHKLVNLFGEKTSYSIPDYIDIGTVSNKAFYKLNEEELFYLSAREKVAYPALKAFYTRQAQAKLGFDFNTNFGIMKNDNFNIQSLSDFEDDEIEQKHHIPLSQELVNKIISAKKYKIEIVPSPKSNINQTGRSVSYYLCQVDNQVVPLAIVEKNMPIKNTSPLRCSQSISVFVLLKGQVPFFLSRLDFDPFNKHTNKLKNGQITNIKIQSRGTHQHIYSERFSVIVPSKRHIMHCDAETYTFLNSFEDAKTFVSEQNNITLEKNLNLEQVFKNDVKKAHKQKKYKRNLYASYENMNFNL